jgi:hypothetical protein
MGSCSSRLVRKRVSVARKEEDTKLPRTTLEKRPKQWTESFLEPGRNEGRRRATQRETTNGNRRQPNVLLEGREGL